MKDEVQGRNDLRRSVLDALNAAAPALECLNTRQEQCDEDGVMVKVSRQALDEVLSAVNEVAIQAAITPTPIADSSAQKSAPSSIGSLPSGESDPSVMLGFDGADTNSCPADSSEAGTGDMPFERFPRLAAHIERMANTPMAQSLEEWSNFIAELNAALSAPVGGPGDELRMLRERLGPRGLEVVQIEGRGHYVNEAVKAEIEKLRSADRYDHGYADGVEWAITRPPALSAPVGEPELLLSSLHRQIKAVADHPEHYWIGKILLDVLERETGYGKKVASVVGETVDNHEAICEAAEAYVSAHRLMSAAMKDGLNVQGALSAIVAADEQLRAFYTHPPAPAVGAEDVARAANWKLVDGTMTTGESVIFDGSFIVAKVTRRQDAELILSLLSGQGGGK